MLIQCHSCNTKYRLNLEQIPRRKTFVRCKNCGTPIFIDATEEEAPSSGVIPPPPGMTPPDDRALGAAGGGVALEAAAVGDPVQVVCPSCSARYRIPAASLRRPGVKLKCTQCGHLFAPPAHLQPPAAAAGPARQPAAAGAAQAGVAAGAASARGAAGAGREMPLPDEQHMEQLFDDLRPEPVPVGGGLPRETELGSLAGEEFPGEPALPDSEQAYLESVSFDDEGGGVPAAGTVPDEQKFRFFLNPKRPQGSESGMADQPEDKGTRATFPPVDSAAGELDDLPSLDPAPGPAPVPSTEVVGAKSRDEMAAKREVVPGQAARVFTEKRVLAIVAAASLLILLATGAWGYWLAASAGDNRAFRVRMGQPHQLVMKDDLQGHFVTNASSGKRLFVVNGEIDNRFPADTKVRWIRIKGLAYSDPTQSKLVGSTFAYAGNVLEDGQLAQWELAAVKAYYGFTNGRKELNLSIAPGAKVPYQLVFTEVEGQSVGRTIAQVVSYHRDGQAVFVDNP